MRSGRAIALTILGTAYGARSMSAQSPTLPPLVVIVRVVDTAGLVVTGADVAVVRGINTVRAAGTTDANGRVSLSVADPQGDYQLVVRKIGYKRHDEFLRAGRGPLSLEIVMHRTAQALAPVRVTAQQDLKRKSYFIDADEIAQHADELIDASDILKKLKPDMICGRSCSPFAATAARGRSAARACPISTTNPSGCRRSAGQGPTPGMSRTNAWVNGRRVLLIATDPVCLAGQRGALAGLSPGTMQILCEIRPEHIEQISYVDEFDNSVGKVGSNSALFIVLKEGVVYEPGKPSYVRQVTDAIPGLRTTVPSIQDTPLSIIDSATLHPSSVRSVDLPAPLPAYRRRVLGVFDQDTGDAIAGARVIDTNTGTYATTTATGTVSLAFLPEGSSLVRITKEGYEDLGLAVEIGPSTTEPFTLLMKKKP